MEKSFNLLVASNQADIVDFVSQCKWDQSVSIHQANEFHAGKSYIQNQGADLLLIHHCSDTWTWIDFLKGSPLYEWVPVILILDPVDESNKNMFMENGLTDVLVWPDCKDELQLRIQTLLHRSAELISLIFRDPLTRAYNRRYFDHLIEMLAERHRNEKKPISIGFIDADRFKQINDTHGHDVGDLVLQGLASLIQGNIRKEDTLVRFGGEEFVIICPGKDGAEAKSMIDRILDCARQEPIAHFNGDQHCYITFSSGVSELSPNMSIEEWIKQADDFTYAAKKQGRNRVLLASDQPLLEPKRLSVLFVGWNEGSLENLSFGVVNIEKRAANQYKEVLLAFQEIEINICVIESSQIGFDGMDLAMMVKQKYPECKVIYISERKKIEDLFNCLKHGIDQYLESDYRPVELEIAINRFCQLDG